MEVSEVAAPPAVASSRRLTYVNSTGMENPIYTFATPTVVSLFLCVLSKYTKLTKRRFLVTGRTST